MKLYLFNPSHDEALASGSPYYYPSAAARRLAEELALLPALCAREEDAILLPGEHAALKAEAAACGLRCRLLTPREFTPALWREVTAVCPWGWDALLRHTLRRLGAPEFLLPDDMTLSRYRRLSSRATGSRLLPAVRRALGGAAGGTGGLRTVGHSVVASTEEEVMGAVKAVGTAMVKSLWSCSGRGVFRMTDAPSAAETGRLARLLSRQGGVEVQACFEAVLQFAMEYEALPGGSVRFLGLSVFRTNASGGYAANLVAPQQVMVQAVADTLGCGAVAVEAVAVAVGAVVEKMLAGGYEGPLGVDMMVVRQAGGSALFPCMELNLRRTMGHVALCASRHELNGGGMPQSLKKLWYFYSLNG